jgi:YVTN family beta-propeller protein
VTQLDERSDAQLNIVEVPGSADLVASGAGAVWVGSPLTGTIARINPRSATVSESFLVPARRGAIKELAVGQGALWISSNDIVADQYRVFRIDPSTGKVVATIPLRLGAQGIDVGQNAVWVASPLGNTVSQIEPSTNRVVHTVRVGKDPIAVAVGEGAVWVTNYKDGTVSRIDPQRARIVETIKVGPNPDRIAAGEGGVWVTVHPR